MGPGMESWNSSSRPEATASTRSTSDLRSERELVYTANESLPEETEKQVEAPVKSQEVGRGSEEQQPLSHTISRKQHTRRDKLDDCPSLGPAAMPHTHPQ